jgi:hypothetical protein
LLRKAGKAVTTNSKRVARLPSGWANKAFLNGTAIGQAAIATYDSTIVAGFIIV